MKKFKFLALAVMAMLSTNAFAVHTLTSGAEQTIDGISYKVITVYDTEDAANGKINAVSAEMNNFTGTSITIPDEVSFKVQGTDDADTPQPIDKIATFKVVQIGSGVLGTPAANAFKDLTNVTSLTIGKYVQYIGATAFKGCTSLSSVTISEYEDPTGDKKLRQTQAFGAGIFENTTIGTLDLTKTTITTLNKYFEDTNASLTTVKLPATLVTIANSAFEKCGLLSNVDLSLCTKLTTIGSAAFGTTPSLTALDFSTCESLQYFTIDGTGTTVDGTKDVTPFVSAGGKNNKLTTLTLNVVKNKETKYIGTALQNLSALTTVNIAATKITALNANSLAGLDAITELEIPSTCVAIAATGKTGLTKLTLKATTLNISAASAFTMDKDLASTITIGNIAAASTLTAGAFVVPAGEGKTTVTIGNIAAAVTNTGALVNGKVAAFNIGSIANSLLVNFFGQAEKITFKGNITAALDATGIVANNALTELDFGSVLINTADLIPATAFDETYAPNLVKVTWQPAATPTAKGFNAAAFGSTDAVRAATTKFVQFITTQAVATYYGVESTNLKGARYSIVAAALSDIPVANNGTGNYYYGKFYNAASGKIAIKQDGATVIVYGAYVNSTEPTKVYVEQLHIIDGYYYIPATTPVIVKSSASADVKVETNNTGDDSMQYEKNSATLRSKLLCNPGSILGVDLNALAGANETIFAMGKTSKHNLKFLPVDDAASLSDAFYVKAPKSGAARLQVIWLDGSEPNDETTAIETIKQAVDSADIYNLAGQKVDANYKGVVIKNGKKMIQK